MGNHFYEFRIAPETSYKLKADCVLSVAYFNRYTSEVNITSQFMSMVPAVSHYLSFNRTQMGFMVAPGNWASYVTIYVKDSNLKNMLIDGKPFTDHSKYFGKAPPSVYYNGEKWRFLSASFYGMVSKNYVTVSNTDSHALFATMTYGYVNGGFYGHPILNYHYISQIKNYHN